MTRFIIGQLRQARGRTLALAASILVVAVSFTLLTSAVTTSQLRVRGAVTGSFRAAYDVLVRPPGSTTAIERQRGLVQQNYLGGIFGGITRQQYEAIKALPGVEVAAPIANLGYAPLRTQVQIPLDRFVGRGDRRQVYRVRWTWLANGGASRYPDTDTFVYVTPHRLVTREVRQPSADNPDGWPLWFEAVPGRGLVRVCSAGYVRNPELPRLRSPYDRTVAPTLECASARRPPAPHAPGRVTAATMASPPMLLAAIDPEQESRLVGLDRAIVAGRYLRAGERDRLPAASTDDRAIPAARQLPVLLSTRTYVDQALEVTVDRLRVPADLDLPRRLERRDVWRFLRGLRGQRFEQRTVAAEVIHRQLVREYGDPDAKRDFTRWMAKYTQASQVTYGSTSTGRLEALPSPGHEREGRADWTSASRLLGVEMPPGQVPAVDMELLRALSPPGIEDVRYRRLVDFLGRRAASAGRITLVALDAVGQFDPAKLPGFSPLSQVPLETYHPPEAHPADEPSRRALRGRPLRPTFNVGGYVAQPPFVLTTLDAMEALLDEGSYHRLGSAPDLRRAPISAIRVRVAGVQGPDPASRERIRQVAEAIQQRTGLTVDVTAGSSPQPILVGLQAGRFGQPPLLVREGWVRKGVAVVVLRALDRKSLALLGLVLLTCGLFLANGSLAAVRTRRRELGVLRCLGWSPGRVFAAVLGELVMVGAAAGVAGTLLAAALARLLDLRLPACQMLLVWPVALTVSALAGLPPAWRAARGSPLDAVSPSPLGRGNARPVRGPATIALRNLGRLPGRTVLGAAGLVVGVAALTVLLAINQAFQGAVAGTLLGDALAARVRPADYASVALAIVLGAVAVADVCFLNLRERAAELLALAAAGWRERHLRRLVGLEGVAIGMLGSGLGAAGGLAVASQLPGADAGDLAAAALAAGASGTAAALVVVTVTASLLLRLPSAVVLGEE